MARRTPLIPPGSVLPPRERAAEPESVLDDVLSAHRRRKGLAQPEESPSVVEPEPQESQIVRKSESQKERKTERKQESLNETTTEQTDLIDRAVTCSTRPGGELLPWGTRLPKALKKRLDYQAFRLKEHKISGQGLTILALERLLSELEALEQSESE